MTPAEWVLLRADWLLDVRVVPGAAGGFDVVVPVDGSYARREDAERAVEAHRAVIAAVVAGAGGGSGAVA